MMAGMRTQTAPAHPAHPITSERAKHFQAHGWVAVPDFWNAAEIRALQAEVADLKRRNLLRNVATDGDGKTTSKTVANLQICPAAKQSRILRALPYHGKVQGAIGALVGDPVLLWLDQIFLKPAHHGAGTNWHQDDAYFQAARPTSGVGMWTAIHAATVANGTMRLAPRPGRMLDHSRDPGSDHHISCAIDESTAFPIELPAGGVVFFAFDMPHCTKANTTDRDRAGLAYHFSQRDAISPQQIAEIRPWYLDQLTGPGATDGRERWGESMTGVFAAEVERLAR